MTTIKLEGKEYQIDIEQAKKLGLLKEKDDRVRSWEEFKEKYSGSKGYYWSSYYNNLEETGNLLLTNEQLTPHEAKALASFSKLLKLRRDWIGEWEPDWSDVHHSKGVIWSKNNELAANTSYTISQSLSFPTYKMAQEFLETFHDLIEDAKILI
jgi:hypothetical protein